MSVSSTTKQKLRKVLVRNHEKTGRLGTINTNGLACDIKLGNTIEAFEALRLDVLCLQEVHRPGNITLQGCGDEDTTFISVGYKNKSDAGVGVLLSSRVTLHETFFVSPRIMKVHIQLGGLKLAVLSVYAPPNTDTHSESFKDKFYADMRKTIKSTKAPFKLIILGDMNATIGGASHGSWNCLGSAVDVGKQTNANGERLLKFCDSLGFTLENTRRHRIAKPTWRSATGYTKRIDYIVTDKFLRLRTLNCRTRMGSSLWFTTDHYLQECNLRLPKSIKQLKRECKKSNSNKPRPDIDVLVSNHELQVEYCKALDRQSVLAAKPQGDVDQVNANVLQGIQGAIRSTCPVRTVQKDNRPWENDELRALIKSQKNLCGEVLGAVRKQIRSLQTKLLNTHYDSKSASINHAAEARMVAREFKEIKRYDKLHGNQGRLLISKDKLREHFKVHFAENTDFVEPEELNHPEQQSYFTLNEAIDVNESVPTQEEVESAMRKLRNQKSQGVDKCPLEGLKYGRQSPRLMEYIMFLIGLVWSTLAVPALWLKGIITALHKKHSFSDPANYRGITITANLSRLIPIIILDRTREAYNRLLEACQCGFRPGVGCDDAIFVLRNVLERTAAKTVVIYVDLTAAYDTLNRNMMYKILSLRLGTTHLVALIKSIYENTTCTIRGSTKSFPVAQGCRQGGIEAPFIFNVVFDTACRVLHRKLLDEIGEDYGHPFEYNIPIQATNRTQRREYPCRGHEKLYRILYADDMAIMFRTIESAQKGLIIVERELRRYGLKLSRPKTETMMINFDHDITSSPSLLQLDTDKIKNTTEFKYLGVMMTANRPMRLIEHRIASACAKWHEMKRLLKNGRISAKIRGKYMNTFIRSRLCYNGATWNNPEMHTEKLNVEWLRLLRKVVKGGFRRKPDSMALVYTNNDILHITGCESIHVYMDRQQAKWLAHCIRMPNSSLQKQTLFMIPTKRGYHSVWTKLERKHGIDKEQFWSLAIDKTRFNRYIDSRYSSSGS